MNLRSLTKSPITRELLQRYAVASTDPNQIHLDDAVAKAVGLPGVIAHGMLTMAFMGEFLHQAIFDHSPKNGRIIEFSCRFKAMTFPGDIISIAGEATPQKDNQFNVEIEARNQKNEITATGTAVLKLP